MLFRLTATPVARATIIIGRIVASSTPFLARRGMKVSGTPPGHRRVRRVRDRAVGQRGRGGGCEIDPPPDLTQWDRSQMTAVYAPCHHVADHVDETARHWQIHQ